MTISHFVAPDCVPPDRAALERLLRAHGGRLLASAVRLLGCRELAKAAVAEACRRGAATADRDGDEIAERLHRLVLQAALQRLASRQSKAAAVDDLLPTFEADGHRCGVRPAWNGTCDRLLRSPTGQELLQQCIDRLPDEHRTLLLLADVEGLGLGGAATMLGIGREAARMRLHRARQALRELLERGLFGEPASRA